MGGWGAGSQGLWAQRHQHSPVHPIEKKLRQHRQQQLQHHFQRLRQSQSCPPRRWVADGVLSRDHDSASAPGPRHSSEFLSVGEDSSHSEGSGHDRRPQLRPSVANPGSSLAFLRGECDACSRCPGEI